MRVNRYLALVTGMSRRSADGVVENGRVVIDGVVAKPGTEVVQGKSAVFLDGKLLEKMPKIQTIMLNKPVGYVVSRDGQGDKTIYELLPQEFHHLKPVGRLDKYSSGLLLLTNDGKLAQDLTHPSHQKTKIYEVELNKSLQPLHRQMISDIGIKLEDGVSKLALERQKEGDDTRWIVQMHEGRNRQIRRTFAALGYHVRNLHRTQFGNYTLSSLISGQYKGVDASQQEILAHHPE